MGWTCQFDMKGFCKRVQKVCVPGMKGCILQTHEGIVFSNAPTQKEQKKEQNNPSASDDFAALARSN